MAVNRSTLDAVRSKALPPEPLRQAPLPQALPQFAHIARHWQPDLESYAAKLLPGEYYVTTSGEMISTVLGSCVSACVRDSRLGIGGMNHFMLPLDLSQGKSAWGSAVSAGTRYGNVAMERLVNDILKLGGTRDRLEIKLVGGGRVLQAMSTDVGARNIEFVREYVRVEGLALASEDLGDIHPRKVQYFPSTGRLRVRKLTGQGSGALCDRERYYMESLDKTPIGGEVELF
jgi:chemotaxis protein CheD